MAVVGLVLVALDQLSKGLVIQLLGQPGNSMPLWPGVLHLHLIHNEGVAFGLLRSGTVLPVLLPVLALVLLPLMRAFLLPRTRLSDLGVTFVMAGGLSNLIDKLLRGYVVDFFEVRLFHFAVFNVADIYVTVGIALILLAVLRSPGVRRQERAGA